MKSIFLLFFSLCIGFTALAQCPFTVSSVVTESRCAASGTITINPSLGGSFIYQITAGPITTGTQTTNSFAALPAGNYTVTTTQAGCTVTSNITVPGTYVNPSLQTGTVTNIVCPTGTGCINANQPTGGRLPYTYALISGPVTRPTQASQQFCGLPAGIYQLQSNDSCGVVRTTNLTVAYDTGTISIGSISRSYANCTDLIMCQSVTWVGSTTKKVMVWYVSPVGDTVKSNILETLPKPCDTLVGRANQTGVWQILAYDSCGRVYKSTINHTKPTSFNMSVGGGCSSFSQTFSNPYTAGIGVKYVVRKCSDNSIVTTGTYAPQTSFQYTFTGYSYDTCYKVQYTTDCLDTINQTFTVSKPLLDFTSCTEASCSAVGRGNIGFFPVGTTNPVRYTIIAGPSNIGTTVVNTGGGTSSVLNDLLPGAYTIEIRDTICNTTSTKVVNLTYGLTKSLVITTTPNCSGGQDFQVTFTTNAYNCRNGASMRPIVTALSPVLTAVSVTQVANFSSSTNASWTGSFINVTAGNLTLRISNLNGSGCFFDTTLLVLPYTPPVLNTTTNYFCSVSGQALIGNATGGKAPYQYRVRPTGSPTWGAYQTSPVFTGLSTGIAYDVNVIDVCPNGDVKSVFFQPFAGAPINTDKVCPQIGQSLTFTPTTLISGVTYQWIKDGVVLGTSNSLTIPSWAITDNGTYKLVSSFGGCTDTTQKVILDCTTLPLSSILLSVTKSGNSNQLSWTTQFESNLLDFEVENSNNGVDFTTITSVASSGNSNTIKNYAYLDSRNAISNAYYRIKWKDIQGRFGFSNIVFLKSKKLSNINIYPNPISTVLNISVNNETDKINIELVNSFGQKVYAKIISGSIINTISLPKLPSGVYVLTARKQQNSEVVGIEKVLIQ